MVFVKVICCPLSIVSEDGDMVIDGSGLTVMDADVGESEYGDDTPVSVTFSQTLYVPGDASENE